MSTQKSLESNHCAQCVLDLLCLHLPKAKAGDLGQMQEVISQFRGALEDGGVISVAGDVKVQMITPQTKALVNKYFSPQPDDGSLPLSLQRWLTYQISQLIPGSDIVPPTQVMSIELNSKQLTIRFIAAPHQENYLLLLEERNLAVFSVPDLESLGLSTRRAEVLFWIAQDKSNAEIAKILDCSEGTVRKHVELIYKKLEVHTRAGAVITALRQLGMINR